LPSIREGGLPGAASEEANRLLQDARGHLASGAFEEARETALSVIELYPEAPGSGEALGILAEAALELDSVAEAVDASRQYLSLLDTSHPAYAGVAVVQARSLAASEALEAALQTLLLLPMASDPEVRRAGLALAREVASQVGTTELGILAEASSEPTPTRGVIMTELAVSLFLSGQGPEAERWAQQALDQGLETREAEVCRGILAGSLENILGRPVILGAILPRSGVSPALMEYGEWVLEGIQVAVEEYQSELRRPVRVEVMDHAGEGEWGRRSVQRLEEVGALGVVGPLSPEILAEVAAGRDTGIPVISPFAYLPAGEASGVLSLSGPDPGGAEVVALYAWDLGLERVVVLRPATDESRVDAEAFQQALESRGGIVPQEIVFDPGATFFQSEFEQVASSLPDGLFLPLAPRDIQLLAPQFTYYGLDTLGIQLLGTTGWTDDEVVQEVDSRHTDGVIASTTRMSQDETEEFQAFRVRYEEHFQKTLRSQVPAYGYDAAVLLLEAARKEPRNPVDLLRALEEIEDYPGATGHLSVGGGRIRRVPQLVRIQNHELIYITPHFH
jgi:ABC-type branched-subunit amino acid transport system substrate-binding protein